MGLYGSFEMVDNNINLNIFSKDNNDIPTKEQILEKLKEIALKKKKKEKESQINAICKEKIVKGFRSSVLENFFKFNSVSFGVCDGVGNLDYRDYPKNINFNMLLVESIENYLLNAKDPENKQQKALLTDFLEVYDKNIEKGFNYLKPRFF